MLTFVMTAPAACLAHSSIKSSLLHSCRDSTHRKSCQLKSASAFVFCSCLVTSLHPLGNTYINRVRLPRSIDTEAYLGDILSFGELTMAFQLVPVLLPERQKSAIETAVHHVKPYATKEHVPKDYSQVGDMVRVLYKQGSSQFPESRSLMATSLAKEPVNAEGWAQVNQLSFQQDLLHL